MRIRTLLRRFKRHNEGATAVEFAIIVVPFFLLFVGALEFGLIMFTKVVIEGATTQVSRASAIGTRDAGCDRVCTVQKIITEKTAGLINGSQVSVTASVVSGTGAATRTPDFCLVDGTNPYPATCTGPFEDNDGVAGYQQSGGLNGASIGNAGDLVEIRVSYPWRVLFPLMRTYFGSNGVLSITSSTLVKNEQF